MKTLPRAIFSLLIMLTCSVVSAESYLEVRTRLAQQRDVEVARLVGYTQRGVFPHNETDIPALHMFKDGEGRRCAVAELIHQDGRDDLVDETARTHNDLAIVNVHDGQVMDWLLSTGLTQEELVTVQLANIEVEPRRPNRLGFDPIAVARRSNAHRATEAEMKQTVVPYLQKVVVQLRANREKSLDLAAQRALAHQVGSPVAHRFVRVPVG